MNESRLSLDDLYKMIAHTYSEQNAQRPPSATFAHFVEVCGMLTIHSREKKREGFTFVDALCKAFGWYFPLMAKFKVASIEELVFRKFPQVCPYCRLRPHKDILCKTTRGTTRTVDHKALRAAYVANLEAKPTTINDWQQMFAHIYPRSMDDAKSGRSTLGLFEELGELAEAVRVFDRYPKYFAGEAADVFSYLMGLANEYELLVQRDDDSAFSLEDELIKRYPGVRVQCGHVVCICPFVPEATVGRMAKELDLEGMDELFRLDHDEFSHESIEVSSRVLDRVGGYAGLVERFPFDRGDTNKALVLLCIRNADAISESDSATAESLRGAALKIGAAATYPGSKRSQGQLEDLVSTVRKTIEDLPQDVRIAVGTGGQNLEESVGRMAIPKIRVIAVFAGPADAPTLRLTQEDKAIRQAIERGRAISSHLRFVMQLRSMTCAAHCWMMAIRSCISPATATPIALCLKAQLGVPGAAGLRARAHKPTRRQPKRTFARAYCRSQWERFQRSARPPILPRDRECRWTPRRNRQAWRRPPCGWVRTPWAGE